jgi:hypothetical protein
MPAFSALRPAESAESQNRTGDTMIFSHVLYQLSYLGLAFWKYISKAKPILPTCDALVKRYCLTFGQKIGQGNAKRTGSLTIE